MGEPVTPERRASSRTLVGRLEELSALESHFEQAVATGSTQVVLVEGPAGIGKSRLVTALGERVASRGGRVLVGHCLADGAEILPHAPVAELLGTLVRTEGVATISGWAGTVASELNRLVPGVTAGREPLDLTRASASRLFQAMRAVLDGAAARHPRLVVVEDLHWVDHSTRELLGLLVQQVRGPVLFLFTRRTDEAMQDSRTARFLAEIGRRGEQRVVLRPLTRAEQALQISDITGLPPTPAALDDIYVRAEGNPFFAEELLALDAPDRLPPTLRDLLSTRLEVLSPATQQLLRVAAVIGRRSPHGLLASVAGSNGDRLEETLREAVRAHVLQVDPAGGYLFRHALLHEAVAATLLPGEAVRMHRRVAEVLTEDPDAAVGLAFVRGRIAGHWLAAGDRPRAFVASMEAAREARQSLAFSEALRHFETALRLLDDPTDVEDLLDQPHYWLLWSAAETAHLAGFPYRAAELVREAIARVDTAVPEHHGYLYERLGRYLWMGADGVGALAAYERAVELVPAVPPTRWRAAVLSGYAQILMLASRFEEARRWALEAIEVSSRIPDGRSVEGHARCNLGVALARLGELDAGAAELREARRIAEEEFDDVDDIARSLVNLASVYVDAGRLDEAEQVTREAVAVVDDLGLQRRKGVWCRCDAAHVLLLLGRYDEARRVVDEARDLAPQGVDAMVTDLRDGQLLFRTGRVEEAEVRLRSARDAGTKLLDGQLLGPLYATLVEVATWRGDPEAATSWAAEGGSRLRQEEDAPHAVPFYAAAASAAALLASRSRSSTRPDHLASAAHWLDLSARTLARTVGDAPLAVAADLAARCEVARAEHTDTSEDWHALVRAWDEAGDPFRQAESRLRLAESLLRSADGREHANEALVQARDTAARTGAAGLLVRCDQLATRARLGPRSTDARKDRSPVPFRLTPREREVLCLVARGLSDREIGTQLFISHRTVERHVSNLLAKFDASRRSQLAAAAHRNGLAD